MAFIIKSNLPYFYQLYWKVWISQISTLVLWNFLVKNLWLRNLIFFLWKYKLPYKWNNSWCSSIWKHLHVLHTSHVLQQFLFQNIYILYPVICRNWLKNNLWLMIKKNKVMFKKIKRNHKTKSEEFIINRGIVCPW